MTTGERMERIIAARYIDSELGRLTFWGSECRTCGNSTAGSMRCDDCDLSVDTVALWMAPKEEKG